MLKQFIIIIAIYVCQSQKNDLSLQLLLFMVIEKAIGDFNARTSMLILDLWDMLFSIKLITLHDFFFTLSE